MKPAYHIQLSPAELQAIGEVVAIQGQIEWIIQHQVVLLLSVLPSTAAAMLGSSGLGKTASVWIEIARCRLAQKAPDVRDVADHAYKELTALTQQRNDFIHAFYAEEVGGGIMFGPLQSRLQGRYIAVRTSKGKRTALTELQAVRDRAAAISVLMATILNWLLDPEFSERPTLPAAVSGAQGN